MSTPTLEVSEQLSELFMTTAEQPNPPETPSPTPSPTVEYVGTATCTIVNRDGTRQQITCSVSGALSYQDARTSLEMKMNAAVRNYPESRIDGSITIEIRTRF